MKKQLLGNIAVFLVVTILAGIAGVDFIRQRQPEELYKDNPNLTRVIHLSDYNENLEGTAGDTEVYVFESGVPGGKALIYGGTHSNELAGEMMAVMLMENVKCEAGTLYVIVHANNSGVSHTTPLRAQHGSVEFTLADGSTRTIRIGSRLSNPVDSWPDPNYRMANSGRELKHDECAELRNLNRNHPGVKDGYLTEQICYAIYNMVSTENINLVYDGHEAGAEGNPNRLANLIVSHDRGLAVGANAALTAMLDEGIPLKSEISGQTSFGTSHRGLGDNTEAYCNLMETVNPIQGSCHGKVTDALIKDGAEPNITALINAGLISGYEWTGSSPLATRTGYQLAAVESLIKCYTEANPDNPIVITGIPEISDIMADGLEAHLKSLG